MNKADPIDRAIEAKLAKIANAERAISKLKIEVAALREVRDAVADVVEKSSERIHAEASSQDRRKGRSLSAQWKQVLSDIAQHKNDGADLDQIERYCRQRGIDLKRPTLRAQMSNYVKRTYLGRTGDGKFFIAMNGLIVAGLMPAGVSGTPAQTGAPENGEDAGIV